MNTIISFVSSHQTWSALIAFWLGSNVVGALPSPDQSSGKGYKFVFSLMHGLAGSLPRLLPNLRVGPQTAATMQTFFGKPPDTPPAA